MGRSGPRLPECVGEARTPLAQRNARLAAQNRVRDHDPEDRNVEQIEPENLAMKNG